MVQNLQNQNFPVNPCAPLLNLNCFQKTLPVPAGLFNLVQDMSLEVLRYQPTDVYQFLSDYLFDRISKRNCEESPASATDDIKRGSILNEEELNSFLAERNLDHFDASQRATKIQAAFKGYIARKKYRSLVSGSFSSNATQSKNSKTFENSNFLPGTGDSERRESKINEETKQILKDRKLDERKASNAATLIQARFRGYKARKELKPILEERKKSLEQEQRETDGMYEHLEAESENEEEEAIEKLSSNLSVTGHLGSGVSGGEYEEELEGRSEYDYEEEEEEEEENSKAFFMDFGEMDEEEEGEEFDEAGFEAELENYLKK